MGTLVTIGDAVALNYCRRGIRQVFAQHGLNYLDFVRNGISEEKLLAMDDIMATRVVERAHQRLIEESNS